jgi:hypothetical protein
MRLTIIPEDGAVYVNGVSYSHLDLSFIQSDVHALQWYDSYGEIEFKRSFIDGKIVRPANQVITELPDWANACKSKWDEAKANEEAAILAAKQAALLAAEQEAQATQGTP